MSNKKRISRQEPGMGSEVTFDQQKTDPKDKLFSSITLLSIFSIIIDKVKSPFILTEEELEDAGVYLRRPRE